MSFEKRCLSDNRSADGECRWVVVMVGDDGCVCIHARSEDGDTESLSPLMKDSDEYNRETGSEETDGG